MASLEIASVSTPTESTSVATGPLAGLSKTLGMSTLSYPLELGTDDSKKHYVTFLAKEITPQSYAVGTEGAKLFNNIKTGVVGASQSISDYTLTQLEASYNNLTEKIRDLTGTDLETAKAQLAETNKILAEKAGEAGKNIKGVVETLNGSMDIKANRTSVKSYISLYMPDTLQATYHADYASISMRDELGQTLQSIRTIGSIAGAGLEGIGQDGLTGAGNAIGADPAAIKFAIDSFGRMFEAGQGLSDAILQTQGYTSNPQLQMIYHGASFRTFSLNFMFTPKSRTEALVVENIIHQFKYYAAPTLQTPGQSPNASMFLTPPALFEVRFFYDGNENKNLPRYTDCVLEDISVDYAPNGWAAHAKDGVPIQTQLTLSFHEVEIVDKARLQAGFNSRSSGLR